MTLRRGFKTEANHTALEVRAELGLHPLDPFDPLLLASHLDISALSLSIIQPESIFLSSEKSAFSAVTVFAGPSRTIVHNDAHAPARQRSNIAHELSHALLMHPPTPALDDRGCRDWSQDIEDEASWLASVLLISEDSALNLAAKIESGALTKIEAARTLGVSQALLQQRLNATGAFKRLSRRRSYNRPQQIPT